MDGVIEIALCDDDAKDIETVRSLAERFSSEHKDLPMRLSLFTSAAELLENIENDSGFDLYILDVLMPEVSGMQLAEAIRGRGEHSEIVFLTNSRDYAVDAFSVFASGYLIKPVVKESFDKTVLRAVQKLSREMSEVLTIKTKDGIQRIPLSKIVMIESFNHTREIILSDNSMIKTSETLSELNKQLRGHNNFYMIHRSYIANLNNSVGIVRYDLLMLGNRRIPISRSQFSAVQDMVKDYFFKRENM